MKGLPDNPWGQLTLDFVYRDPLTTIKLAQSLSHRSDKLDLLGDVMQRSTLWKALKQVFNNLFIGYIRYPLGY